MCPGYFIAYLFGFPMFYPTSPPYPSLLGLLEYDHSIRGSLSPVWLQKKGIWLRVIFKTTNVTIVSDCGNPNHGLWICYSCASKFLRHFGPQAWSGQKTMCILSLIQRPLLSCGVCNLYANTTPPAYPETAPSLWVWNSALKWSSWAPESKPRQDHGDGRTSTKDKMWTTIPFGITPDFFLSLYLNHPPPPPSFLMCACPLALQDQNKKTTPDSLRFGNSLESLW